MQIWLKVNQWTWESEGWRVIKGTEGWRAYHYPPLKLATEIPPGTAEQCKRAVRGEAPLELDSLTSVLEDLNSRLGSVLRHEGRDGMPYIRIWEDGSQCRLLDVRIVKGKGLHVAAQIRSMNSAAKVRSLLQRSPWRVRGKNER